LASTPFAVEYEALGNAYWDKNADYNYNLDIGAATGEGGPPSIVLGLPNLLGGIAQADSSGNLTLRPVVKNIAYEKQVGIVYTIDGWQTFQNAFGHWVQSYTPASTPHQLNTEQWEIVAPVGVGATGQYAFFYTVGGATYWDNNFGLNYSF